MHGNLPLGFTILLLIVFYFVPAVIAKQRDANNFGVIFGINLLFGWTVLGWIAALIWAIIEPTKMKVTIKPHGRRRSPPPPEPLTRKSPDGSLHQLARQCLDITRKGRGPIPSYSNRNLGLTVFDKRRFVGWDSTPVQS